MKTVYYAMGIPLKDYPESPEDQPGALKETCPICNEEMWVSKKKRELRDKDPELFLACGRCVVRSVMEGEKEREVLKVDINLLDQSH